MTLAEAIDTTRIHSGAGLTGDRMPWVTTRPFRAPYHTISDTGLIGCGHVPMPGEVSRAHHGVLFLDELSEFRRHVLEVLRQPLEEGVVTITRMLGGYANTLPDSYERRAARAQMGVGQIVVGLTPHAILGDTLWLSSDQPECKIVPIPFLEQLSLLRESPRRGSEIPT